MKYIRILLLIIVLLPGVWGYTQNTKSNKEDYSIVYVVERGKRSSISKYLYKDLLQSSTLRRAKLPVTVDFVAIKDASSKLFDEYDVVIAVNENTIKTFQPSLLQFITENQAQKNLIVTAFLPKGKSKLTNDANIDVISSASYERPAANLVKKDIAQAVVNILQP